MCGIRLEIMMHLCYDTLLLVIGYPLSIDLKPAIRLTLHQDDECSLCNVVSSDFHFVMFALISAIRFDICHKVDLTSG